MVIEDQFGEIIRKSAVDVDGLANNYAHQVTIAGPRTVFGDFSVSQDTPLVQIDSLYGILPVHETFTATGGSVGVKTDHGGKEFECSSGTSVGGYGLIRSKRAIRYRPGQGVKMRFTGIFPNGFVPGYAQRIGGITSGTELSFGYHEDASSNVNGEFGILWRTAGRLEIRKLTLSAAATGAETVTITLNSVAYTVSVTSGTTSLNAHEIASDSDFGPGLAFKAYQVANEIFFFAQSVGAKGGTYSVSSTGTLAGTFSSIQTGTNTSDTWIYQSEWDNQAPFGGTAIDPSKGNVFQIEYGYLGYSGIRFSMMNPLTNQFVQVHQINYPNTYEAPHLNQPMMKLGLFSASLGGSGTDVKVRSASLAGFVSGPRKPFRNPTGRENTKVGVGTTYTNILSIKVMETFSSFVNLSEILPQVVSAAVEGTKPVSINVFINPDLGGTPNWQFHNEDESIALYDVAATTVTGIGVFPIPLGKSGNDFRVIKEQDLYLVPGDILTIAAKASSGTADITVGITWQED